MPDARLPLPQRRSARLPHWNYSSGACFVTVCTTDRRPLLGNVKDGTVILSAIGQVAESCWSGTPRQCPFVSLDLHVIMPNHIHGLLFLEGSEDHERFEETPRRFGEGAQRSLGAVIRAFKATATRLSRDRGLLGQAAPLWQRGYWEHVVRSPADLDRVREYVETNPARWDLDRENPQRTGRDDLDAWMEAAASTTPR